MKNIYFSLFFFITSFIANAQDHFIIVLDTNLGSNTLNLNTLYPSGHNFNYTIDLGNGTVLNNVTQNLQYTYSENGVYTITITGDFPFFSIGDCSKLISIEQWGDIVWQDMSYAFADCDNLAINATDTPDLSQVSSMNGMFALCDSFNHSINNWDVSNVSDMGSLFASCTNYNQPLDNWDVSNVENMAFMFSNSGTFNQPIDNWNVSNVESMREMFSYAYAFNQPINNWNVSSVSNMNNMFLFASSFNQLINNWNISNVTSMNSMFYGASTFDQVLNDWQTLNLNSAYNMFKNASSFNQPLDAWDVSNLNDFEGMFDGATSFNQSLDNWDFSNAVYINDFVNNSGLNVSNYDDLLLKLASFFIENVQFGAGGLQYCDTVARSHLINELGWQILGDTIYSGCNIIEGMVYYDYDSNGCMSSTYNVNNVFVQIGGNGLTINALVNESSYSVPVVDSGLEVSIPNLPDYFSVLPESVTVYFDGNNEEQIDFCLTANQSIEDINITILPIDEARPGFEANYLLVIENIGTQTVNNVSATLIFDDTMQSFVSANPAPVANTASTLDFNIASLAPFTTQEIAITMQTFTPPTVNGDDILNFTANVSSNTNDYTPSDNTYILEQIVVNSFDPNDKRVLQGNEITLDQTTEYLDYVIRFQNTGSATAINVRIEDDLHPNLDWNTLRITSASHEYNVEITNGNEVEFIFDNINLPFEAADEPSSHGYIAYKIKPIESIQIGDIMSGNVGILFDYNLPIITNTVSTEVVEPLSVEDILQENLLTIYPNPADKGIHLKTEVGILIYSVSVYSLQGRQIKNINQEANYIDIGKLNTGIYLLTLETNKGNINKKIVVK